MVLLRILAGILGQRQSLVGNLAKPARYVFSAAQHRLHRLHTRLRARGKPGNISTVAVARELACFLWAAAVAE